MQRLLAAFIVGLWASVSGAQVLPTYLDSIENGRAWEAVGLLEIGGRTFCTASLIAPDLVLTAAHCLYDRSSGKRADPQDIQFKAGWRNGRAAAYRRVKAAVHLPDYRFEGTRHPDMVRHDVALVQLSHAIRNTTIAPFRLSSRPAPGSDIGVVSYDRSSSSAPSLQETCKVMADQDGVLVMSCAVDFGASGSPVFLLTGDGPRLVSVVSSKARALGREVSLGTELEGPVRRLKALLDANQPIRRISASGRRETGAKFVKP